MTRRFTLHRLILSLLLTVLVASIGLGLMFDTLFSHFISEPEKASFAREKALAISLGKSLSMLSQKDAQEFISHWSHADSDNNYSLELVSASRFPLPPTLSELLNYHEPLMLESASEVSVHYLMANNQIISLSMPVKRSEGTAHELRFLLTTLFYLALLLLVFVWLYPLLSRLIRLREAAISLGSGALDTRVEVGKRSYIADIENAFNHMAQRVETLLGDVKLLSASVSHDLRTPLARIRFGVETLVEEDDPVLRARFQSRIVNDVDQMVELVEQLLNFARLECDLIHAEKEQADVVSICEHAVKTASCPPLSIRITTYSTSIQVLANKHYLLMVVNNLLSNATRFANSTVSLTLENSAEFTILHVEDDGPGIPESERENVLVPFTRIANQEHDGYGLGLAAVRRIAEFYRGYVCISTSIKLKGARVSVHFKFLH